MIDEPTIAYLCLWAVIAMQQLTIRALNKRIENERKLSDYWREAWLKERNKRC